MAVEVITQKDFEEKVLGAKCPVLLEFYKEGDAICEQMDTVLEQVQEDVKEQAIIWKIDINQNISLAFNYQVMELPAFILMNYGIFQKKAVGPMEKEELVNALLELANQNGTQTIHLNA